MSTIGNGVSHNGLINEDFLYPWNLASAIVAADVGKAVSLDTGADRTVKLAADGDMILGILKSYEDRVVEGVKVGAVAHAGAFKVTYKVGETFAVGSTALGGGSGTVKVQTISGAATGAKPLKFNLVTAVDTVAGAVEIILF